MSAPSPHVPTVDATVVVLDAATERTDSSPIMDTRPQDHLTRAEATSSALTTTRGSFSAFLAPLTQETFRQVVSDVEAKLKVVNQTLSMLELQGFESILEEMLSSITFKIGELLNADRTSIFLLDEEKNELYSIIAKGEGQQGTVEIRIPADKGIAGEVATFKRVVNIPYDFYDDPRSAFAKIQDQKNGYRTYTMLALPLLDEGGNLVAVVQLLNKLKPNPDPSIPLEQKIDLGGFTANDEEVFREFAPSIRLILQSSRSFYIATQRQRAANALIKATQSLSQSSLDLDDTLRRVMDEAKSLMNADRSTLWLLDRDRGEIWTKILVADGSLREFRYPIGVGFAGQVAATGEVLNIPFDLYDMEGAETAKKTDQSSGYRTCSLLCMPVFADGELIGVTQLVNKKKQGEFPAYDPADWPKAPECWKASFNRSDQEFMEAFNIQAGVALKNAKLFATVKQQEQLQRDILRSLSNGVISTNKEGQIIAANESAKQLLGLPPTANLEGRSILDLVHLEKGDFRRWFMAAIEAKDGKSQQQYYPDQTLQPVEGGDYHSINLSINTITIEDAREGQQVSGALVVMDDISDEKRLKSTMYRYMTQELAEQLLENPDAAKMGGDRKEVTVLFSDIRSYTTLTESLSAEEVVDMLNKYFEAMVDAVFAYKGTLDKYIGDAIMAVFGSPLPLEDHEWMAVQTAIEMRHRLAVFNEERIAHNYLPIRIGIGINSDVVISGNIGSSKRMEFTAIGDGVNLGARLESASKIYGTDIVISEMTYRPCAERVWARELDYITVKGKTKPVAVYELIGLASEPISDVKKQIIDLYHQGRKYYLERNFPMAMAQFGMVLGLDKHDKSAALHLERCQHYLQNPPPEDWDGAWVLTEK
ncbi:GAF domain-containing protein [Trichothermofontia sichuanensis B231]|uniref:GAF domain-containing protein n=1 Tax=Trichothermofontia sichuanensis TaxID=3045816 RepID=UPI002246D6C7|nr:adenylate/guanylate cyclase domain-containing protein [Trichothermofontia sichuanensis]UZQ55444.1 GAF domain-containing protein [Trichothermofontia sichuanensis B231]